MAPQPISTNPTRGNLFSPSWGELRPAFRELFFVGWMLFAVAFTGFFGFIASFEPFGFDRLNDLYPFVADGWGLWYWLAQIGLGYTAYLLVVNTVSAALIFRLAVPRLSKTVPIDISLLAIAYFLLWFLFGQARYGMALAILAPAAVAASWPVFWICGLIAVLIHKGVAGALLLLFAWRILRTRRKGLVIAALISVILAIIVHTVFGPLLELAGYANYAGWSDLPAANTPLRYYYLFAVFILLWLRQKEDGAQFLTLAVLFLPTAYYNVFAGRALQACSTVLMVALLRTPTPWYVRLLFILPYAIELVMLVFTSGLYF